MAREMNEPEPLPGEEIDIDQLNYLIDMGQIPDDLNVNYINQPQRVQQQIIQYFSNL